MDRLCAQRLLIRVPLVGPEALVWVVQLSAAECLPSCVLLLWRPGQREEPIGFNLSLSLGGIEIDWNSRLLSDRPDH
jgi:hypothetical protein